MKAVQTASAGSIDILLSPSSIAVIGATPTEGKLGNVILRALIDYGFKGRLFPVNPNAGEVMGLRCYPDVASVVKEAGLVPDTAYITVPPPLVPGCLRDCASSGVKGVTVVTSDIGEKGLPSGHPGEQAVELARGRGTLVLGPNCLGVHSPAAGITFNSSLSHNSGPVMFLSQSGSMTEVFLLSMESRGIGTALAVSTGNEAMLTICDFMDYAAEMRDVRVIAAYVEEIRDPERFLQSCSRLVNDKVVVVYKAGTTRKGSEAASSHTGAIAGSTEAYASLFKKGNALFARSYDELVDLVTLASSGTVPSGKKTAVVSAPGGLCVTLSDALDSNHFDLRDFGPELKDRLAGIVPGGVHLRNPLDLTMAATTNVRLYSETVRAIASAGEWDLFVIGGPTSYSTDAFVSEMESVRKSIGTPLVVVWMGEAESVSSGMKALGRRGIAAFGSAESAASCLAKLSAHEERMKRPRMPVSASFASTAESGGRRSWLGTEEIRSLLSKNGIVNYDNFTVRDLSEATSLAERLGYPLVLKLSSPGLVHKSEQGGVVLGIQSRERLAAAFDSLLSLASAKLGLKECSLTLSRHISGRIEVVIGSFRSLGAQIIMFGMGGLLVELSGLKSFALCPLNREEAMELILESGMGLFLEGYRGIRLEAENLTSMLVNISEMLASDPSIVEMDINPLISDGKELWPADVRILREEGNDS